MGPITKIHYNKLMAKFMEVETCTDDHGDEGLCYWVPSGIFGKHEYVKDYGLKYDQKYDWLMPVVNKCINISHFNREDLFSALTSGEGIDRIYSATAAFIEWYLDPNTEWIEANGYPTPEHKLKSII